MKKMRHEQDMSMWQILINIKIHGIRLIPLVDVSALCLLSIAIDIFKTESSFLFCSLVLFSWLSIVIRMIVCNLDDLSFILVEATT
jgi:hypothetical protein